MIADPVPYHPLLAGRREIGRGENTIVLDGEVVNGQAHVFEVLYAQNGGIYPPTGCGFRHDWQITNDDGIMLRGVVPIARPICGDTCIQNLI
jgi:hypothetical protein